MSVNSRKKLVEKLKDKEYRDAYTAEHVKTSLPLQVHILRDQRNWTQSQLAERAGTTQTVIARIEDPNYGNLSINSLLKLASAFDVALLVKFVPFSRLLEEFEDLSPEASAAHGFDEEIQVLEGWTNEIATPLHTITAEPIIWSSGQFYQTSRRTVAQESSFGKIYTTIVVGASASAASAVKVAEESLSIKETYKQEVRTYIQNLLEDSTRDSQLKEVN